MVLNNCHAAYARVAVLVGSLTSNCVRHQPPLPGTPPLSSGPTTPPLPGIPPLSSATTPAPPGAPPLSAAAVAAPTSSPPAAKTTTATMLKALLMSTAFLATLDYCTPSSRELLSFRFHDASPGRHKPRPPTRRACGEQKRLDCDRRELTDTKFCDKSRSVS